MTSSYYLLRCVAIVLLGLLVYAQTFQFGFVFDDHIFIVTNPYIKNFNNIHLMWQTFPMTRLVGMYSFALNYYFNQLNPQGYHIFNFVIHLISTGLVWALTDLLFKITKWLPQEKGTARNLSFMVAALFLVHPCQTQAVTYITQRFESMATLFYLGAMYVYLSARLSTGRMRRIILFGLCGFLTILGLMTKEVVITLPAMILASELILFSKADNKKTYILFAIGGFLLFMLFSKMVHAGLNVFSQSFPSESHDGDFLTPARYFLTQMRVFLTFFRILILPIHQNLDYDYPASTGILQPPLTLIGLSVIAGIIFLVFKLRRQLPLISFGLAWVLITFSINMVPRVNVIFEHKLYLISFGFFLSLVVTLSVLIHNRGTLFKILWCMIAVLTCISYQRNRIWTNEVTLWEDVIKESPHKARVNANLGRVYGSMGHYDEAIDYLGRSIAIKPDNITYENRGIIYGEEGRYDQALADLGKSIEMDPKYFMTYLKRAWVYQTQHNYGAAFVDLAEAIRLDPYFTDAYIERGMLWMDLGHNEEAIEDFRQALRIDPFNKIAKDRLNSLLLLAR